MDSNHDDRGWTRAVLEQAGGQAALSRARRLGCCSVLSGQTRRLWLLEDHVALLLGALGIAQRTGSFELVPHPAARFTLCIPAVKPRFMAHGKTSCGRPRDDEPRGGRAQEPG